LKNLEDILCNVKSVGIAGHVRPDGDCIGSCLATYNYIKTWHPDIKVTLYLEPIPNIFKFISHSDEIVSDFSSDASYDLFIVQDCSDISRIGGASRYFEQAAHTVCIDHHVTNNDFADDNYIFPKASSTSELIFGLLCEERITREIAESIYTGIVHDTGVFQYSCTSKHTMEIAGCLMEKGIDYSRIIDETFYTKTYNQNRIMGLALIKSKLHLGGLVISSVITEEEMREYDVLPKHLDGIVSQLRVTKDVEVAIFLYQTGEEDFKVSMRSVNRVDVAAIAFMYGGGGHVRAAGCTIKGESDDIIARLVREVERGLEC
jgi:phosphoesterase RecJ-like protein